MQKKWRSEEQKHCISKEICTFAAAIGCNDLQKMGRCSPLTYVSIQTAYMTIDVNPQASFSLIADFDGNMDELMHTPFDLSLIHI